MLMLIGAAGCSSVSPPSISPPESAAANKPAASENHDAAEVVAVVPGRTSDVYALVARGAHRCWFGANGVLKPTHVFHAEADPQAKGGAAEIVLHERDETMRDKRGPRAFRMSFSAISAGVRVGVEIPKMEQQLARAMVRDVAAWSKGGEGCSLQLQAAPTPPTGYSRDRSAETKKVR